MNGITRKKLIEVSIPLEAIDTACERENNIRHGHPFSIGLWWSRKRLAVSRSVLFAQLVDDPSAWPNRFPTDADQDAERERLHRLIRKFVIWEASNDERILDEVRWEIARSVAWNLGTEPPSKDDRAAILAYLQCHAPAVYDPFSGGGSIPLEAERLGLRAYGSDLNPVAVLVGKALVEIPPKFAGLPPVNPEARAELKLGGHWNGKGADGLAEDVRYYGQWMRGEAARRIGDLYPEAKLADGSKATVVAWLWVRTVRSPDPAARGAMVPLVSSFMLSTKRGKAAWAKPIIDKTAKDGWRFDVQSGKLSKQEEDELKKGTMTRSGGICLLSGASMPFDYIRKEGQRGALGLRLMAIVAEGDRQRIYLSPTTEHEQVALSDAPDAEFLKRDISRNTRDFRTHLYGFGTFYDLFTPRQITGLSTLAQLVNEVAAKVRSDALDATAFGDDLPLEEGGTGARAYSEGVATYMGLLVSQLSNHNSTVCGWNRVNAQMRSTFALQALPMTWDPAEANIFSDSSGSFNSLHDRMVKGLKSLTFVSRDQSAAVFLADAAKAGDRPFSHAVVCTDPPYYDNIGYSDLSDFFYVWQKEALSSIWPGLYRRIITPKDDEIITSPFRHGGEREGEDFFFKRMRGAIDGMRNLSPDEPITIYYAYKEGAGDNAEALKAGWSSFLQALVDSGLVVEGTWPIRTERAARSGALDVNAMAASIVLTCRSRAPDAGTITRSEFVRLLKRELPDAIDDIRQAGVGPVDMQQSVIGPGMGVFSRHARVLEDDDSSMKVKTALAIINRVWGEIENEADAALDPETQVALAWFASYGFDAKPSGELITLANAKNVPQQALFDAGVFTDLRGRAQLTPREQLPADWTPETDKNLTVWECIQHTARTLSAENGGEEAAARLIVQMSPQVRADVRQLADRLFQIATDKGWSQEALVYNELGTEWHRLIELSQTMAAAAPTGPVQSAFDLQGAA